MTDEPIRHGRRTRIRIASIGAIVCLVLAFWSAIYQARLSDRNDLVSGCDRAMAQRKADIAQDADLATVVSASRVPGVLERQAASEERLVICTEVYPAPSVWPWSG